MLPRNVLAFDDTAGTRISGAISSPAIGSQAGNNVNDLGHRHVDALFGQRGDRLIADPARHDVLAHVGQVGRDVEGKTVHGPALLQPHANCADLAFTRCACIKPNTRIAIESARIWHAEFDQYVNNQTFDTAHVPSCPERVIDVQNWIADELAGAVVRDVTTALGSNQLGTNSSRLALQVGPKVGCPPIGKDVRVLEEQQMLVFAVFEERRLHRERFAVRHAAQPPDSQRLNHNSVDQSLVSRISLTRFKNPAA